MDSLAGLPARGGIGFDPNNLAPLDADIPTGQYSGFESIVMTVPLLITKSSMTFAPCL